MKKILITYGTRPLAQRISKLICDKFEISFASSEEVPSFLQSQYSKIPTAVNPTFAHELLKLGLDKQIDYILPLGVFEITNLADSKILFEEYGIIVLSPDKEFLDEIFILENPSPSVELQIYNQGISLDSSQELSKPISGLISLSDDGESFALCSI